MSITALLGRLVPMLDAAAVPYMIAGSFASTLHGVPRTTHDIDIVIDPVLLALTSLVERLLAADFYVDADVAQAAMGRRGMFNAVDPSGWKIDFMIRKARPFSDAEFARRQAASLFDVQTFVATAEDTIIAKLEWAHATGAERQLRDVAGIVAVVGRALDRTYIDRWTRELGLDAAWASVLAAADQT